MNEAASYRSTEILTAPRAVRSLTRGMPASDGAGVKLFRIIGQPTLPDVDPFLMLDEFGSDDPQAYIAGFPDHPHRGFETVTVMLAGRMRHRDNRGNEGLLGPGDVQWMTAGRGIVHSEMPEQKEGLMRGFQLWLNLPAAEKMRAPDYDDISADRIPLLRTAGGGSLRLIAGRLGERQGPAPQRTTEPVLLDVVLSAEERLDLPLPASHAAFAYLYEGSAHLGADGTAVARGQLAVLEDGDGLSVQAGADGASLLVAAARPLREPVAKYGPFVMNSQDEIHQAIDDFRRGLF